MESKRPRVPKGEEPTSKFPRGAKPLPQGLASQELAVHPNFLHQATSHYIKQFYHHSADPAALVAIVVPSHTLIDSGASHILVSISVLPHLRKIWICPMSCEFSSQARTCALKLGLLAILVENY